VAGDRRLPSTPTQGSVPLLVPLAALCVAAILSALVFFPLGLHGDALGYYEMSLELMSGEKGAFYWPPGWPLAMAGVQGLLGPSQNVARGFSFVLALVTLWLQLRIARRALLGSVEDRRRWWTAYGLILLNSPYLLYCGTTTLTVVPLAFLGSLLVYCLLFVPSQVPPALLSASMTVVRFGSIGLVPAIFGYRYLRGANARGVMGGAMLAVALVTSCIVWTSLSAGHFVWLNRANSMNLYYGNHSGAPIYETWRWGSHSDAAKRTALADLAEDYSLDPSGSLRSDEYLTAMRTEATAQILRRPDLFILRMLTRLSVLLAFDSSVGSTLLERGRVVLGIGLLVFMALVSLATKTAAILGALGSDWKERHLVWVLLGALFLPHLIAFAHPSYSQMFTTAVLPVVGVAVARVDRRHLETRRGVIIGLITTVALCHVVFAGYMAYSRL
jgi:hypothetical protein